MAQASAFSITPFTNPSKEIVFRVTGWLDGKRIRKNFPTRAEAVAERQTLDIHRVQSETGIRPCLRTGGIFKLKPTDVRLDTGVVLIEPEVSKARMKRNVTIQPNLAA